MSFRAYDLLNIVKDFGKTLTLRKHTVGTYDADTGTMTNASTTDYSVSGYFFNYDLGILGEDDIRRGRRQCVIAALGLSVSPDSDDQLIGTDDTVNITQVRTFYSGSTALCYIVEVEE